LIGCSFTGRPAVKNMPLCQWRATTRGRKPSGDGAQPMATREGLKVLLHWAGPSGGEPWVTFTEPTLTAEDVCIHVAHKVGESRHQPHSGAEVSAATGPRSPSCLPIHASRVE